MKKETTIEEQPKINSKFSDLCFLLRSQHAVMEYIALGNLAYGNPSELEIELRGHIGELEGQIAKLESEIESSTHTISQIIENEADMGQGDTISANNLLDIMVIQSFCDMVHRVKSQHKVIELLNGIG